MTQQLIAPKVRTVRFYACGGAGTNILRAYRENQGLEFGDQRANEKYSFIDTSVANLHNADINETFLLKGADGSGSDRRKNGKAIYDLLPEILLQHEPGDFNVVVFSLSGGTGSVAGPLLLERLLREGHSAAAVVAYDSSSLNRITNTLGTMQGLEAAVERIQRPIGMFLAENDSSKSLLENNIVPQFVLSALSILASGKNAHLDSSDVANFFDFNKVTHQKPSLALLEAFVREEDLAKLGSAISFAALLNDRGAVAPAFKCDYNTVGYLPEGNKSAPAFYYALSAHRLNEVIDGLLELQSRVEKEKKVAAKTLSLNNGAGGKVDEETGLIF